MKKRFTLRKKPLLYLFLFLCGLCTVVVAFMPRVNAAAPQSCEDIKPEVQDGKVYALSHRVMWTKKTCPMVVETWQGGEFKSKVGVRNGRDVGIFSGDVTLGELTRGDAGGGTVIKFWYPGTGRYETRTVGLRN